MFTLHVKGHCSLCSLDQKSGSVKALSDEATKSWVKKYGLYPWKPFFPQCNHVAQLCIVTSAALLQSSRNGILQQEKSQSPNF